MEFRLRPRSIDARAQLKHESVGVRSATVASTVEITSGIESDTAKRKITAVAKAVENLPRPHPVGLGRQLKYSARGQWPGCESRAVKITGPVEDHTGARILSGLPAEVQTHVRDPSAHLGWSEFEHGAVADRTSGSSGSVKVTRTIEDQSSVRRVTTVVGGVEIVQDFFLGEGTRLRDGRRHQQSQYSR